MQHTIQIGDRVTIDQNYVMASEKQDTFLVKSHPFRIHHTKYVLIEGHQNTFLYPVKALIKA